MADIPFIDTHFHLHDLTHPSLQYGWLGPDAVHPLLPDLDSLKVRRYLIRNFIAETRFANVSKAVHVQAAVGTPDPVEETAWLQAFADETGFPHGIIAECHLGQPDVVEVLDKHMQFANVRGVRDFGEGNYIADANWRKGFAELASRQLVSCIDTRIELASDLLDLAQAFPKTTICVDHCALPLERNADYFRRWREAMDVMASAQNVIMKVSGLGMCDPHWTVDSIRPYLLGSIEAFGVDRIVFATNWPVDRLFSSYPDVVNAYAGIISDFTQEEQVKLFSGNAERVFRL